MGPKQPDQHEGGLPDASSEMQLVRILDRTLRGRYPDGVSLIRTLEGGSVLELHRQIRLPFDPYACARSTELTQYLWAVGRPPSLEPGGGVTIRSRGSTDKFNVGRAFYREAEDEYRLLHAMISDALGKRSP